MFVLVMLSEFVLVLYQHILLDLILFVMNHSRYVMEMLLEHCYPMSNGMMSLGQYIFDLLVVVLIGCYIVVLLLHKDLLCNNLQV